MVRFHWLNSQRRQTEASVGVIFIGVRRLRPLAFLGKIWYTTDKSTPKGITAMTPILTAAQMKSCDAYTIETIGIPSRVLMERAAHCAVEVLLARPDTFPAGTVLLLCGSGNNGGDGFAMARFLTEDFGWPCRILYAGRLADDGTPDATRMSPECRRQYELATAAGIPVLPATAVETALQGVTAVVDAVFGIGLDRPVAGEIARLLTAVAESGLPVLAVDIPSGIHADNGSVMGVFLPSAVTVTMQALKAGLLLYPGADACGEIVVAELGISLAPVDRPWGYLADEDLLRRVLPPRARRSHKGTYGRLALLCGSEGMSGAAVLATRAALRCGAGLAETLTPAVNRPILQATVPEAIVTIRTSEAMVKALRNADGAVMGCGLGADHLAREVLRTALEALPADSSAPLVLDADGLNLLAAEPTLWDTPLLVSPHKKVVITPHPAEMARLCGISVVEILQDLPRVAADFAREKGVTVVLKDAHTVIVSPEGDLYVCAAGNAGLAKGGSGDALAGVIGALLIQNRHRLGQGITVAEVAAAGVCLHAAAADRAAADLGEYGMLTTDVIERIPLVCRDFSDSRTIIGRI